MRPKHSYRSSLVLLMALVAFAFTAALSSDTTPPSGSQPRDPAVASSASPFTLFESGQVRPLAMSPDKRYLFAVNTPDNRLEIFRVRNGGLLHSGSIPVGL
ncbi:MAG TPA: hypothetical protein VN851_18860, partial [Thermoanaerobaculia bacterium]|nr:hypothetical protein [Thermoanaerobaculia bacterium]